MGGQRSLPSIVSITPDQSNDPFDLSGKRRISHFPSHCSFAIFSKSGSNCRQRCFLAAFHPLTDNNADSATSKHNQSEWTDQVCYLA
jgi:hypothetical protein